MTLSSIGTDAESPYYTGDYKISLNYYTFNSNFTSWLGERKSPPLTTLDSIRWCKEAGFDAVDVTAYYIPGYVEGAMPSDSARGEIMAYARDIRKLCAELDIELSGTGARNDFAQPDPERRALDVQRLKFYVDVAVEMGAPALRVFSGKVPADIDELGWETITRERIVPPLREVSAYAAERGVRIGLQNHGDMLATAEQTIKVIDWVDHPNLGIVVDTGCFRPFRTDADVNYDWYGDIAAVLPYGINFQIKQKPAGTTTDIPMDLPRLLRLIRSSAYRGYLPFEMLWLKGDPGHPETLDTPPFEQISDFLAKLKAAVESTKTPPA